MRVWVGLIAAVGLIAGSVLYAARTQQQTAETNFGEAQIAANMRSTMLQQEWGLYGYALVGVPDELQPYYEAARELRTDLAQARAAAHDDAIELAAVNAQAAAWKGWQVVAGSEISRVEQGNRRSSAASSEQRDTWIERFLTANATYSRRLQVNRTREEDQAALVPVWLVIGLSGLFLSGGWFALRRVRRARTDRELREQADRVSEVAVALSQSRFAEAMQVSEDQNEAHRVLAAHLETTIEGSSAIVLNRNNSANRLESAGVLEPGDPLRDSLIESKPRSCLAVRLSRQYDREVGSGEVLSCELCGKLDQPSTCQPLLVGGEVIGSVLVEHSRPLAPLERRRLVESVAQAAPVLANLRNLALAENRASTDALTGLPNRREIDNTLKHLFARATRARTSFSVAALDLDRFKQINDTYGHGRGDDVLASLGALLQTEIRGSDIAGRTGGEEFVLLLPDTDRAGAFELASKVCQAVRRLRINGVERAITASIGIATFPEDAETSEGLTRLADRALYTAKRNGRDRVEMLGRPLSTDLTGEQSQDGELAPV